MEDAFQEMDVGGTGCVDFRSFVRWYDGLGGQGKTTGGANQAFATALRSRLTSLQVVDKMTGKYDFLTARRVLLQLCIEQVWYAY